MSEAAVSFSCRIPCRFGNYGDKGINLRVHSLDLTQDRFRDLGGGERACPVGGAEFDSGEETELILLRLGTPVSPIHSASPRALIWRGARGAVTLRRPSKVAASEGSIDALHCRVSTLVMYDERAAQTGCVPRIRTLGGSS